MRYIPGDSSGVSLTWWRGNSPQYGLVRACVGIGVERISCRRFIGIFGFYAKFHLRTVVCCVEFFAPNHENPHSTVQDRCAVAQADGVAAMII